MRQRKRKPWQVIGMSRASWYRHGKPTEKPDPPMHLRDVARLYRISIRTAQRMNRVAKADPDMARAVLQGAGKWGQAERLIKNPKYHRKWREASELPWPVPKANGSRDPSKSFKHLADFIRTPKEHGGMGHERARRCTPFRLAALFRPGG